MQQSKSGSYYDSTKNARPYTNSYGGSDQYVDEYDDYNKSDDDYGYEQEKYGERRGYGYRSQRTSPRYYSGNFSGYDGSNYQGISYKRFYTGYSTSGQDDTNYPSSFNSGRNYSVLNRSNERRPNRRRRRDYRY